MAGWTANGTRQKVGNTFLQNFIGFETDDVFVILTFKKFTKVGRGKSGIPLEIVAQVPFPVTLDDRFQNVAPAVGAMNIAGAQRTPLKVTELVEQEQRMLAGAAEVTIVSRSLLFFMGRTDAAVHVENDHFGGRRS